MSLRHMTLVWTHAPAVLRPGPLVVLLAMADSANDETGCCWLSVGSLARKTGLSDRQVQRIHDDLVADGWLEDLGSHPDPRYRKTTVYRIVIRQPAAVPAVVDPAPTADTTEETEPSDKMSPVASGQNVTGDIRAPESAATGDIRAPRPVENVTQSHREPSEDPGDARARSTPLPPASPRGDETPEARKLERQRAFRRWLVAELLADDEEHPHRWWAIGRKITGPNGADDEVQAAILLAVRITKRIRGGQRPRFPGQVAPFVDQVAAQWRADERQTDLSEATETEGA